MRPERDTLVGRVDEIAAVTQLLTDTGDGASRLVTLTGPGGVGKTRLAVRLATDLSEAFASVVSVDLRGVDDPDRIAERIADAAGALTVADTKDDVESLVHQLADQHMLLVCDNAEQVADGLADVVGGLLDLCPYLRVLVTSRSTLEVPGEQQVPLTGLTAPHPECSDWPTRVVPEAVELFRQRARAIDPGFTLATAGKIATVGRICNRLAGFPLLVEIVAARARMYSVEQLEARLDEVFQSRWGARRSRTGYGTTFRSVMQMSWELCSEEQQAAWRRLAVFADGFTVQAAMEVCCDNDILPPEEIDNVLDALVRQSLVTPAGDGRLSLLEPIRHAGWDQLVHAGEVETLRQAHARWILAFTHEASVQWCGPDEVAWLDALRAELPNVRAALSFYAEQGDLDSAAHLLAGVTRTRVPFRDGTLREWRNQLDRLLRAHETASSERGWTIGCAHAGWIAVCQGSPEAADIIASARRAGDRAGTAEPLVDYAEAVYATFGEGNPRAIDQWDQVRQGLLRLDRPAGDFAMTEMWWAIASAAFGSLEDGQYATEQFLADAYNIGAAWHITWAEWTRAIYLLRIEDYENAELLLHSSLPVQRDVGDHWGPIWWVACAAWIAMSRNQPERAAELAGATDRVMELTGIAITGLKGLADRHHAAKDYACVRLGQQRYDTVYQAGRTIPDYSTACALALGEITVAPPADEVSARRDLPGLLATLTEREREVAELLRQRATNAEIAEHFCVSATTVKSHVQHVLRKLGCATRYQVARLLENPVSAAGSSSSAINPQ